MRSAGAKTRTTTTIGTPEPAAGSRPDLAWIGLEDLRVDQSYQRSLDPESSRALVRSIARNWDWRLCQPLAIARRADGTLYVVDGQHRLEGAAKRAAAQRDAGRDVDVTHLPCVVTPMGDAAEEAATFTGLNRRRRSLSAVEIHRAQIVAGDPAAREVADLIASAGLSLAPHSNYTVWKPGMLFCVPGIASSHRRHGRTVTSAALVALAEAFEGEVLRYAGQILRALVVVYATEARRDGFDPDVFIERLGANSQAQWMRRATERMAASEDNRRDALVFAMLDAYRRTGS